MDLTDEQWALIQPLIPPPSPFARGRPPADPRATLNGILHKLRLGAPWYNLPRRSYCGDLPPHAVDRYPSWQTCYRAYRRWGQSGLMEQIYKLLYQDLRDRAGLDFFQSFHIEKSSGTTNLLGAEINQESDQAAITLGEIDSRWRLHLFPDLEDTWQGSTALLLAQVFLTKVRSRLRQPSTRTLKIHTPDEP